MDIALLFVINMSGVFLGACIVTYVFIWPNIEELPRNRQLAIALSPQMFRLMALGLLHPTLSPGLSMEFAVPTAAVDVLVSLSAMCAVVMLHKNHGKANAMIIITMVLGGAHMVVSGFFATEYRFPYHLDAQWLIPVMLGPVMMVSLALTMFIFFRKA